MSVSDAVQSYRIIERSNKCYFHPNIPPKKLRNCVASFCFSEKQVDFLLDDTVWGSAKDGLAISNSNLYYKGIAEGAKFLDLSSVMKFTHEKRVLGNIEIFADGMPFLTITGFDKAYHDILIDLLNASAEEARRMKERKSEPLAAAPADAPTDNEPLVAEPQIRCVECDAGMPAGSKFCQECGAKAQAKGVCNACSEELLEKAKFCPKCGASSEAETGPAKPSVNVDALRDNLVGWLSGAEQEAWIDSDGDMSLRITRTKPNFANNYRAWCSKHDITISSEGEHQEQTDSACFKDDDDFSISSPYCRVGRLPSARYEGTVNASFFVLKNVEVHEIELKEGALKIPKLGSKKISISSLSARKDDDGSYGFEYELSAYPEHIVSFEFSSEKPEADANVWGRYEEEPTQTNTRWLWDVKPGQKIYLAFGEFEPLVDRVTATFSGDAKPSEGAYDNAEDGGSSRVDDVSSSSNEGVNTILQVAAERMLELDWFEDSIANGGKVQKLALFLTGKPDEFTITAHLGLGDRQDELDEDELQETRSAIDTYFDLNDVKEKLSSQGYDWSGLAGIECVISLLYDGHGSNRADGQAGLIEIFGEEGYEALEFDNELRVKPSLDINDGSQGASVSTKANGVSCISLKVVYNNADTGHSDEQILSVETDSAEILSLITACQNDPSEDAFDILFRRMYDNPNMDSGTVGVLYADIWPLMSRWAFEKLGWGDVTVDVAGIVVDGTELEINVGTMDINRWSLQLTHDGYMYCYH